MDQLDSHIALGEKGLLSGLPGGDRDGKDRPRRTSRSKRDDKPAGIYLSIYLFMLVTYNVL